MEFLGGSQTRPLSSSSSPTSSSLPSLKGTPKDPRNVQGIKNAMCQTCGATHATFKEVLIPTNFTCSMVNRECGFGRFSDDEVISFCDVKAKTKQNEIVYSCNLFCGSGISTWGFRCAGIHSALAFDAYADCLDEHWGNHGDSEGDPPFVITTDTTLEQIESYLRDQPPLSCSHFVVKIGDNVSLKWYENGGHKTLGSLTKRLISQIIIIKKDIITTFLSGESNDVVNVSFVGVATPPCYDISTANRHRSEEYGFSTMTTAFQLLDHCFKNELLATYTIEMVSHARHSELVQWARTSARKHSLSWDYLLASDFNCPSNRERCFFKVSLLVSIEQ